MKPLSTVENVLGWTISLLVISFCLWALARDYGERRYTEGYRDASLRVEYQPFSSRYRGYITGERR
jgi:hypothetical protein